MRKLHFISTFLVLLGFVSCYKETTENILQEQGGGGDNCQCVAYVKHQLQITTGTANAKDWGVSYYPSGFVLITGAIQVGDLIVITPDVGSYWATSSGFLNYGHIGIVQTINILQNNSLEIGVRGANQGSNGIWDECGCPNVKISTFTLPSNFRNKIRIYRKVNPYLCFQIPVTAPQLILPANSSANIAAPILFSWNALLDSPSYRIQISKSQNGFTETSGFLNNADLVVNENTGSNNSFSWSTSSLGNTPQSNTTYYWSVRKHANGVTSQYSTPFSFTTVNGNSASSSPTALGATNITNSGFTCNWTGSNPITSGSYEILVAADVNFTNILFSGGYYVTHTNFTTTGLSSNTWYYYKVRTVNANFAPITPWSNVISVKTS